MHEFVVEEKFKKPAISSIKNKPEEYSNING
jgi:hypothetical protein